MNEQDLVSYALSLPEAVEDYPFGPKARVFKVRDKMFGLVTHCEWRGGEVVRVNLKCDPQEALMLRDVFTAVIPGYHMNKKHWNSVMLDGTVPDHEVKKMVARSYGLIIKGLRKAERQAMEVRWGEAALYR